MPEGAIAALHGEAALAARWAGGIGVRLRLEDGRVLRVVFPGIPGGPAGPDYRDAILEAGNDLLRGDVEFHLRASGWRQHGHHLDPAYRDVVLHVVAVNDAGTTATRHASGRSIPILALPLLAVSAFPPPFVPPCALVAARGMSPLAALDRLGLRRLRAKAAHLTPAVCRDGPGQALYALALATLGGPANRAAFGELAERLPLDVLLERVTGQPDRARAIIAELNAVGALLALRRSGLRPRAAPGGRMEAAGHLVARWWPGESTSWPTVLVPGAGWRAAACGGLGRASAVEIMVNAVLPVALISGAWPEKVVEAAWAVLPSPGTYGLLRSLERWLGSERPPFTTASRLQGGLLLQADYCARGLCGRCPLSPAPS